MSARVATWLVIAVCCVLLLCSGLLATLFGDGSATVPANCHLPAGSYSATATPEVDLASPDARLDAIAGWNTDQVGNAAAIMAVGIRMGVPPLGWVIAVATAMQESHLNNLPGGDRDTVGLFQQRPSQGWGSAGQLLDPVYTATKFYQALLRIDG